MEEQFTFNKRVLSDLLAKYPDTFVAFCELLNNSLQAESDEIRIDIEYSPLDAFAASSIKKITLTDNGVGVSKTEFRWKILEVGTKAKKGGKGVGRFAALQMAGRLKITTVAYDEFEKAFFKTDMVLDTKTWTNESLDKINVTVNHTKLDGKPESYYQIEITDFYGEEIVKEDKHRRIHRSFQEALLPAAIFASYPEQIFQKKVKFLFNSQVLNPDDFVIGGVEKRQETFTSLDGNDHKIDYQFLQVKAHGKHRLFLRAANNNIRTVAHSFDYAADVPEPNQWFILADSPLFDQNTDLFHALDVYQLEPNAGKLVDTMQQHVDAFFAAKYEMYRKFTEQLRADSYYPYKNRKASSESRSAVFNQLAFYVEEKHRLLSDNQSIREIVYALMDRALDSGEFELVLSEAIKLDDTALSKFKSLLDKVDLDEVISFSEEVARKQQLLDFLHKILYSEVAKHVKERKELHKIVEKLLWLFGEQYNDIPKLFSDKNLANNLEALRNQLFNYDPTEADENLFPVADEKLKNITDLFFFNENIIDSETREILIVELKAPKVRLSDKELIQAKKYALQIEKQGVFSKSLRYKIILVGTEISDSAKASCGTIDSKKPYLFYTSKAANVEAWAIHWSDLLAQNKRKLSYLGNALQTKDRDAKELIDTEFGDVNLRQLKSKIEMTAPKTPRMRKKGIQPVA